MHLTVCYVTCRKEPKFEWFLDSLLRQTEAKGYGLPEGLKVVIVDLWADSQRMGRTTDKSDKIIHVQSKPCVWQGPHRLTKRDFFAASNARNTALCYAPDGWIAYVDDLSVLMPTWLKSVREAMEKHYIVCGAYRKVKNLQVADGEVKMFEDDPTGHDYRIGSDKEAVPCVPDWFLGCSLAAPVEAFLEINGWPELCDGMGYEDCITGLLIAKHGYKFKYDRRMMTYESQELHFNGEQLMRSDPGTPPNDKSHRMLELLRPQKTSLNIYNLRELRKHILAGGTFPIPTKPAKDWFTKQPLSEL